MVVGVFPALKLGVLFIKQISKPLSKIIVNQAKNHPVFRTYFIIPPAQFYHWAEVKAKMYLMNLGKPTKVAKLNEQMAIELGASLMGEVIIFGVAGGCLVLEYNRQAAKEAKKEEIRLMQLQKFTDDIQALNNMTKKQEAEMEYLRQSLEELAKKTKTKLPEKKTEPSEKPPSEEDKQNVINRAITYYETEVKKKEKPS
ncbi:putative OPA3-like protein CG13603 [Nasonia vitripennis]|uniref:OPA3-like protein CG13603 n=1 Tax=Nasonia vitripennis TaxID=7425 RepID=A0A7M7LQM8_NASVI|nr:putative OPA3-like protein CG13603 [Nasonia vitripennis]XP_008204854.1 putative OPA3-like protein CG13603 [Nasonia vitripennis]XP_031780556.1 putative OPA3-like protein CG13603 [Nasonia vitripennis]